jgi:gamma-glutamyltranspeptidase/glutathione hydrolase
MVATADQLATQAGLAVLAAGGNAADAAIAANAAIAVTAPHLCGMGGDLFALVQREGEPPVALDASGRAASGSDAAALRAEGHAVMPFRHDIRAVTVPGCVDGWAALHDRFGRLPLTEVLAPATTLAEGGFPASPLLVASLDLVDATGRGRLAGLAEQADRPGARVRRPGAGRALRAIAEAGRDGFYGGEFGRGLLALGGGHFSADDLARRQADWVEPLGVEVWRHGLWTVPPASQGYLALAAAWVAERLPLPDDPDDPQWAHLLVEAALAVSHDRPAALHDRADGAALVAPERLEPLVDRITTDSMSIRRGSPALHDGDTTYLCVVDDERTGVSLIQSNASGFGSWLVEPNTGINLHNRGLGFSLEPGHPAEVAPGRRPPHTLSPVLVTGPDRRLRATLGSMGGDAQPQIVLQVVTRLLRHRESPAAAIAAGRWALHAGVTGFETWTSDGAPAVLVEGHAPERWEEGLVRLGHAVTRTGAFDRGYGHAHVIAVEPDGMLAGAADPRARIGSAAGA